MSDGRTPIKPTPYRDGKNLIKDSGTGTIIYMPPEEKDVPGLMCNLVSWIKENNNALCKKWVEGGFLEIVDASNKARKYKIAAPYDFIVKESL
jgi:hypothetical protein